MLIFVPQAYPFVWVFSSDEQIFDMWVVDLAGVFTYLC